MRFWFLFLTAVASACAQPFSFGVKAGVPLTDFFDAVNSGNFGYFSTTNRYIVGPTAEVRLPFGLGVEFDALYRHLNYSGVGNAVDVLLQSSTTSGAWEFPLLAKYRFRAPLVRPYIDGGIAWDTLSGLKQSITSTVIPSGITTNSSTSSPAELRHNTVTGVVFGGGLDIHALFLHISPEVRFTHWDSQHFSITPSAEIASGTSLAPVTGGPSGAIKSTQNQVEFLVGFTF